MYHSNDLYHRVLVLALILLLLLNLILFFLLFYYFFYFSIVSFPILNAFRNHKTKHVWRDAKKTNQDRKVKKETKKKQQATKRKHKAKWCRSRKQIQTFLALIWQQALFHFPVRMSGLHFFFIFFLFFNSDVMMRPERKPTKRNRAANNLVHLARGGDE